MSFFHDFIDALSAKITVKSVAFGTTNIAATTTTVIPTDTFGYYLVTHGWGVLSFAEWIKLIGVCYILILLVKMTICPLIQFFYRLKNRRK